MKPSLQLLPIARLPAAMRISNDARQRAKKFSLFPQVVDEIPTALWLVELGGAAEQFTYYGVNSTLARARVVCAWQHDAEVSQNITCRFPPRDTALPGTLGLGQSTATNIYNAFLVLLLSDNALCSCAFRHLGSAVSKLLVSALRG